jgi:peptidoglycan-N-acetylglucosamine deacetylase
VRPGSIVLAHDTGSGDRLVTIDRLRAIVGRMRDDGYSFVTVSDLLRRSTTGAAPASRE